MKYAATAVYGSSFAVWLDGSNKYVAWAKLLFHRGWNAYKANELNASRVKTLGEHIDYEVRSGTIKICSVQHSKCRLLSVVHLKGDLKCMHKNQDRYRHISSGVDV